MLVMPPQPYLTGPNIMFQFQKSYGESVSIFTAPQLMNAFGASDGPGSSAAPGFAALILETRPK